MKDVESSIVVVDDGSSDGTAAVANSQASVVLHHVLNRGLGGALATGLEYARQKRYDLAVTFDSDGQHDPKDIATVIRPLLQEQADMVIGTRMKSRKGMPWDRVVLNGLSSIITWLLFGIWTTDSQSGFRAFNRKALQFIQIKTQGMEVSSEFFAEIRDRQLRFAEVPITVRYTDYSRMKGQTNLNSLNIGIKLLLRLFR